jgi:hypothetical protein
LGSVWLSKAALACLSPASPNALPAAGELVRVVGRPGPLRGRRLAAGRAEEGGPVVAVDGAGDHVLDQRPHVVVERQPGTLAELLRHGGEDGQVVVDDVRPGDGAHPPERLGLVAERLVADREVLQLPGRAQHLVDHVAEQVDGLRRLEVVDRPDGGELAPRLLGEQVALQGHLVLDVGQDVADGDRRGALGPDDPLLVLVPDGERLADAVLAGQVEPGPDAPAREPGLQDLPRGDPAAEHRVGGLLDLVGVAGLQLALDLPLQVGRHPPDRPLAVGRLLVVEVVVVELELVAGRLQDRALEDLLGRLRGGGRVDGRAADARAGAAAPQGDQLGLVGGPPVLRRVGDEVDRPLRPAVARACRGRRGRPRRGRSRRTWRPGRGSG